MSLQKKLKYSIFLVIFITILVLFLFHFGIIDCALTFMASQVLTTISNVTVLPSPFGQINEIIVSDENPLINTIVNTTINFGNYGEASGNFTLFYIVSRDANIILDENSTFLLNVNEETNQSFSFTTNQSGIYNIYSELWGMNDTILFDTSLKEITVTTPTTTTTTTIPLGGGGGRKTEEKIPMEKRVIRASIIVEFPKSINVRPGEVKSFALKIKNNGNLTIFNIEPQVLGIDSFFVSVSPESIFVLKQEEENVLFVKFSIPENTPIDSHQFKIIIDNTQVKVTINSVLNISERFEDVEKINYKNIYIAISTLILVSLIVFLNMKSNLKKTRKRKKKKSSRK